MGKYIPKKPKTATEVVSSSGVPTRAKTLALQRLSSSSPNPDAISLCYLQLRSRRLEKPSFEVKKRQNQTHKEEGNQIGEKEIEGFDVNGLIDETEEGSCGDNNFEFENRDRRTRESTLCSLIKDLDSIGTPGSTTKQTSSAANYRRAHNGMQRSIPTTLEMEELFSSMEQEHQRLFVEKYNFDIVNDLPLPGRYEWTKVSQI